MANGSILGAAVKRAEDPRFITGAGRFLSDMEVEGALWMVPVRSDIAHGTLGEIDTEAAESAPGVVRVYRGGQLDMNLMPVGAPGLDDVLRRHALAVDRVRFVGDIVAVVVAETKQAAVDAAHLVWPEIESLPVMTHTDAATGDDAIHLFPELGSNVIYDRGESNESALDDAEVVVTTRVVNQRLAAVPMESNGAVAVPREDGGLDVWVGSQSAAAHRRGYAAVLGLDPSLVHVKVPDVGGGFGAKIGFYAEQALCGAIALDLGRPVRWEEDRRENMLAMSHGRAQVSQVSLGANRDGVLTGVAIRVTQDAGAYPQFGAYLPEFSRRMAVGPYLIPKVEFLWQSVVTNTTPVHAYRGAGRPEATMALERAMDLLAVELAMDPADLRRRNFIPSDAFPHVTAVGERYDSGDYEAALELALSKSGYEELRRQQHERRERGGRWQLGIGVSSYVEITAGGGRDDWSAVEVHPDGSATAYSGAVSNGQGHETTFAQIVSEVLRIPIEGVELVQGDTDHVPHGGGTMASRSLQIAGSAVLTASQRTLHKARAIYAFHREAALDDVIQFDDGRIGVVGVPDSSMSLGDIARIATDFTNLPEDMEPGLRGEDTWEQDEATFPFGTHVCVVEVDTETGDVSIVRHVACDDAGVILNRLVLDGQVHGGIAQGVGQALLEEFIYDESGPTTANLTTYLIPTASTFPSFTVAHTETTTDQNPLGAKGIGEAGTIGSTPAVVNAVVDALSPLGVTDLTMPLTPYRIWSAVNG
ncbi:MAG TPA: xanthine dehydrogenase family protein molybdopterin-binding subunit [Acidimicrobiia bacterium]